MKLNLSLATIVAVVFVGGTTASAQPPRGGDPEQMLKRMPVHQALDQDGDGTISNEELAGAAKALATLDKDGSGHLTPDELRPSRPDGARGRSRQASRTPDTSGEEGSQAGERNNNGAAPGARMFRSLPVLRVLDLDGNVELSSEEIQQASESLAVLDSDNSGALETPELAPPRRDRGDRSGGGRGRGRGQAGSGSI